ncbi:uncharacterized protein KY384_000997 [Bacidia gigantensis]|uniref:uncharacterized protein n=1 Tax=Bacidia gigantensis TaxID=2732470 RepID=UPI001D045062|nr:uncharacterized protein KY384_000997 [Bacidia gigantensis]KAG8534153.1 hypothetical protein KY384_000997 [Bacidia gigantensis]
MGLSCLGLAIVYLLLTPHLALAIPKFGLGSFRSTPNQAPIGDLHNERTSAIKDAFSYAFSGYFSTCKGRDELKPVSGECADPFSGWGASAVDALSTAVIMELEPIVEEVLDYIPTIDFTSSESQKDRLVSLFETTIRYLAGLLSAYDLLKGPFPISPKHSYKVEALLSQAKVLADRLKFAFDSPSGVPWNDLNFTHSDSHNIETNGLATTGTLVLEWQRLSDLTGDPEYGHLAQKAESYLLKPKPTYNVPFPGLLGTRILTTDGTFEDANGGWGGGDDSYYEYLIKMYAYDSFRYPHYRDSWIVAADSTMKYLASHPSSRPDLTFLAGYENQTLVNSSSHLTCFDGGNFLLGGQVLSRADYISFGLQLVDGCHETYAATATHIGPETFSWDDADLHANRANQTAFYEKHGFYITNAAYVLRPEVIESYYYAYRVTGNKKYQDWAWDAFVAINETCRVGKGFSSINDVDAEGGGGFMDSQESFVFAEVLKYTYLIHSDDGPWQVGYKGKQEFVFNTEAHPFKVAGPLV